MIKVFGGYMGSKRIAIGGDELLFRFSFFFFFRGVHYYFSH